MKFAVISDIHGNSPALNAVLSDIKKQGVSEIYNLGDSFYGPLFPAETFEILKQHKNIKSLRGNSDRKLLPPVQDNDSETIKQNKLSLSKEQYKWIEKLPIIIREHGFIFCHGSPSDDTFYLLEQIGANGSTLRDEQEIENAVSDVSENIIFCGHTHIPRLLTTKGGKTIINPGSVGLAAFDDEHPVFHKMESGSPYAKYAVVEIQDELLVNAQFICVSYDFEKVSDEALRNSRKDWAGAVKTGRMVY